MPIYNREKALAENNLDLRAKLAQAERERDAAMVVVRESLDRNHFSAMEAATQVRRDFPHLFTETAETAGGEDGDA